MRRNCIGLSIIRQIWSNWTRPPNPLISIRCIQFKPLDTLSVSAPTQGYACVLKCGGPLLLHPKKISGEMNWPMRTKPCGFSAGRADSYGRVRILDRAYGFWMKCADFQQVVWIVRCPKRRRGGLFRAKTIGIWLILRKKTGIPLRKISTAWSEFTQSLENLHAIAKISTAVSKIRTTCRESAQVLENQHNHSYNAYRQIQTPRLTPIDQ